LKLTKETKIGLIVLIGVSLLFWGLNFLKGKDFFSSDKTVFAIYNQVEGLSASNPVLVNGLKIGLIQKLRLLEDGSGKIIVRMTVTNRVHLPKNSQAQIFSTDILGSKGIRILMGTSKEELQNGDTMTSGLQQSLPEEFQSQVAPIKAKAEMLLSSLDSVLFIIRDVFNEGTRDNLKKSFASVSNVSQNMDVLMSKEGKLNMIFSNLESITTNLRQNNEKIALMVNNFTAISDTIARSNISKTLENTKRALEQTSALLHKVNSGEGSLGQMATNDSLYRNLNSAAQSLDLLLKDFKANPKRYVHVSMFGGGDKSKK